MATRIGTNSINQIN